jgi:mannose-6-phosphate isomerase-like protein (cupin superfamily)
MQDWLVSLEQILGRLESTPDGKRLHYPIRHGTMRVGVYSPALTDPQGPHDQDEIYIVISGSGIFVNAGERRSFRPGDLIFVEAGAQHRFEEFSADFATWVVFWGPKGGEAASG